MHTAASLRLELLQDFRRITGCDLALMCGVGYSGRLPGPRYAGALALGLPEAHSIFTAGEGMALSALIPREELLSSMSAVDQFEVTHAREMSSEHVSAYWAPHGIRCVLGSHLTDGGVHIGFLGGFFLEDAPPVPVTGRLQSRRRAWMARMAEATALEADAPAGETVVVLRSGGRIEYATPAARAWIDGFTDVDCARGELLDVVQTLSLHPGSVRWFRGCWVRALPAAGTGLHDDAWVVLFERPEPYRITPVLSLSRRQREIAVFAAKGSTTGEIGEMLGIRASTVHSHLKRIYQLLGVSTRAELATAVQAAWT